MAESTIIDHPEYLNTPRLIADSAGTPVWKWDQAEPFGNNPADENPSALGAFDLPLRFLGQRYDAETTLHYNYFRDYDPSLGRYESSDPIGLQGGTNTYAYVGSQPMSKKDPFGLCDAACQRAAGLTPGMSGPPQATATIGIGATMFAGPYGALAEWGIARDYKGNICFYYQECRPRGGAGGLCMQGGINIGFQKGSLRAGKQRQAGMFIAGGVGLGSDIQVMIDPENNPSAAKGAPPPFSIGIGFAGGYTECTTEYVCPFGQK